MAHPRRPRRSNRLGARMLTISSGELPPESASVPAAREIVASVTEHLPRKAREAAELVASELATNSVMHAKTPFEVFAAADDGAVEVVVADRAGWVPTEGRQSLGNGLLLVGLLASDWAAEIETVGKRVWARLEIDDVPTY
jgi:anti-sigma regulatory factor (Ser/Thr protein kinase)